MDEPTLWRSRLGAASLCFVGRSPERDGAAALAAAGIDLPLAWARQVHSGEVLEAPSAGGLAGAGDALVTAEPGLALGIAVADCVPVALTGRSSMALAHAGWRGIVAGVVPAAARRIGTPPGELAAWIGPSIGPCCYEVGADVAAAVAAASAPEVVVETHEGKPHLDLVAAVESQLAALGVRRIGTLPVCTACHGDRLWSYRREGAGAGRNFLFGWLASQAASTDSAAGRR